MPIGHIIIASWNRTNDEWEIGMLFFPEYKYLVHGISLDYTERPMN